MDGGIPLGLAVAGANVHEIRLLEATIENAQNQFPPLADERHIALDKGYDSQAIRNMLESVYGYIAHVNRDVMSRNQRNAIVATFTRVVVCLAIFATHPVAGIPFALALSTDLIASNRLPVFQ